MHRRPFPSRPTSGTSTGEEGITNTPTTLIRHNLQATIFFGAPQGNKPARPEGGRSSSAGFT
ncbi:MAG: hypothetical protein ACRDJE_18225 [Dehalococcoidia bacterium]